MTDRSSTQKPRRRLLLFTFLGCGALLIAWVAFFLATFDLNNYRREIQNYLSDLLAQPVTVGNLRYQLHDTRLALQIDGLRVGNRETAFEVDAPDILVDLQWRGLLERRIRISKISLSAPSVRVTPSRFLPEATPEVAENPDRPLFDQTLLAQASIGSVELYDGILQIDLAEERGRVELSQLDGQLENLGLNRRVLFDLQGALGLPGQASASPLSLFGSITPILEANALSAQQMDFDGEFEKLDARVLFNQLLPERFPGVAAQGTADVKLHLERKSPGSLIGRLSLDSTGIDITPETDSQAPFTVASLTAAGEFKTSGEQHDIDNLTLQVDGAHLAGRLFWDAASEPRTMQINIDNGTLPIARLKSWLPVLPEAAQRIREQFSDQGTLDIESASLTYSSPVQQGMTGSWLIDQALGGVRAAVWQPAAGPAIQIEALPVALVDQRLQVSDGRVWLGSTAISFTASAFKDNKGETQLSAQLQCAPTVAELLADWQFPPLETLAISGQIPLIGNLEGPLSRLNLDLRADLAAATLSHTPQFNLKPQTGDALTLHGTLSTQGFSLDHGTLHWAGIQGRLAGAYAWRARDSLSLDGQITIADLGKLAESLPAIQFLELHGQANLSLKQRGWPNDTWPEMTLTLHDAGLTATRHIAKLSRINGRVKVTSEGMSSENLLVHLGQSPLNVRAHQKGYKDLQLILDVTGKSVRADELVFFSEKTHLRDIVGHLEIDRAGLRFAPVNVRLDGGTQATVLGTIAFSKPGDVRLDITSEFVRISEIIGLWSDKPEPKNTQNGETGETPDEPHTQVQIEARAARGDLYGMQFHNAVGTITPSKERLTIHPLGFSVGEGHCDAKIQLDYVPQGPTLIHISGHAEDVDALEVYRELLNQKNIVRGNLRGDFSLQGETGTNFLPSSSGEFNIEIHKGVLHQFPVLSKVLSLLNVSQLFALKLPDMDKEGMPFSKLAATLRLEKGVLSSEDFIIRSEAMNQAYSGTLDLVKNEIDLAVAIHPLGTVDKIVSRIPVAGWLLTGEKEAVLTAHFTVTGKTDKAEVSVQPLDTLTETTIGLLQRTLGLPFKLVEDPQILWGGSGKKK